MKNSFVYVISTDFTQRNFLSNNSKKGYCKGSRNALKFDTYDQAYDYLKTLKNKHYSIVKVSVANASKLAYV